MLAVHIAVVVLLMEVQFVSVYLNLKGNLLKFRAIFQKILAIHPFVVQIHNVRFCQTVMPNVHASRDMLKVQTQFVDALSHGILAIQVPVEVEQHVTVVETLFAIVLNRILEIHSRVVTNQLLFRIYVLQAHVVLMLTVMS